MNNSIYALLHNEGVLYVLNNIQNIPSDENEVKSVVKSLNREFLEKYEINFEDYELPEFPENLDEINLKEWIAESPQSDELKQLLNQTVDVIERELPQKEFYHQLNDLLERAEESLPTKKDRVKFYDHILVARRSYLLWFSEIDNQRSWISELYHVEIEDPEETANRINWWKVLAVDCIGGVMTGTPVGYLGASAISVVMQL